VKVILMLIVVLSSILVMRGCCLVRVSVLSVKVVVRMLMCVFMSSRFSSVGLSNYI